MTHLIPETSLKRDRAVRFGRALERAMKRRDVGRRPLAEAVGASGGAITMWRTGRGLPRLATAADYCRGCEPAGRCVTPECALRPVSPLPLYEERVDVVLVQSRRRNRWDGNHEADARRQTAVWARYTPEERQARIDRAAEASKRARGLTA